MLSFHSTYACRDSGECCTARWPIPSRGGDLLPLTARGCIFHNDHHCSIHASLGHDVLPVACQQFPRVSVIDPRGASITLSCFCPTALAMLDEFDGPIEIINSQLSILNSVEGLDARHSLPPALHPELLMDWESWWEFERLAVDQFNRDERPREILARLAAIVEEVRTWRPGDGELRDRVHAAFASGGLGDQSALRQQTESCGGVQDHSALRTNAGARATNRFLACHAFANWTAHLGSGLRTWLRSLETVVFLLEDGWTIREVDEWLRHWADPRRLAAAWSTAENDKGRD